MEQALSDDAGLHDPPPILRDPEKNRSDSTPDSLQFSDDRKVRFDSGPELRIFAVLETGLPRAPSTPQQAVARDMV